MAWTVSPSPYPGTTPPDANASLGDSRGGAPRGWAGAGDTPLPDARHDADEALGEADGAEGSEEGDQGLDGVGEADKNTRGF